LAPEQLDKLALQEDKTTSRLQTGLVQFITLSPMMTEQESMTMMKNLLNHIPWWLVIVLSITLGLAPFVPQPHLLEKLQILSRGELNQIVDFFDLLLHASPFAVLFLKLFYRFF
jgi:hypothetical protein